MKKISLIIASIFSSQLYAKDYLDLSRKLAKLRTQVEQINENISETRRKYKSELRSYSMQRAELKATITKEEIKKKQYDNKIKSMTQKLNKNKTTESKIKPLVFEYIAKLKKYINNSLPYKKEERIENLEQLEIELKKGRVPEYIALTRLWSAFEDENRLVKENQISKEQIEIDGQKYLSKVLKLGSVAMFFKLENGKYGKVIKNNSKWLYELTHKEEENIALNNLFEGLNKQIKTAEYQIPNVL